jgi:hypothetical protein
MDLPPKTTLAQTELDGLSVGMLRHVVDLIGQIRGMGLWICPDKFETWARIYPDSCVTDLAYFRGLSGRQAPRTFNANLPLA